MKLILIVIVTALIESWYDSQRIKRGFEVNHFISSCIRVVLAYIVSFYCVIDLYSQLMLSACLLIGYSMVFDLAINYFRGLPLYLLGKTALTDRLARMLGADLYGWTALKGVLIVVVGLIYRYL